MPPQPPPKSIRRVLSAAAYALLSLTLSASIYIGPYSLYMSNKTSIIREIGPIPSELESPTFVFCMARPLSMEEKLGGYEDYFIKYLHNKTNWYPYFVDKILYASDPVLMETTELDISHLAFRPVLIDYSRFGICFALDTTWLFREDKRNKDLLVVDLIILFHSRMPDDQQDESVFVVFFLDHGEELALSGPITEESLGSSLVQAFPRMGSIVQMKGELHNSMSECATDNSRLSDCLLSYLEQDFGGECRMPWNKSSIGIKYCTRVNLLDRSRFLELIKMQGLRAITSKTNCMLPCYRMVYEANIITRQKTELTLPQLTDKGLIKNNTGALFLSIPYQQPITHVTEILTYPKSSFIGEIGGYMGLFLGLSFWGILDAGSIVAESIMKQF